MATGKTYFKEIQDKVNSLQDVIDGKDLEMRILENEIEELSTADISITETAMLLVQMLSELYLHARKKGWNEVTYASRKRLIRLIDLNRNLDQISSKNLKLKFLNRDIHKNYQLLRIENKELKLKLDNIEKAENF